MSENPNVTPQAPEIPGDTLEKRAERIKRFRKALYGALVVAIVTPVIPMVQDYQMNRRFEAAGDKYDPSMRNFVAPDLWSMATPNDDLVDIGISTYFRDSRWGHRCMIKKKNAEEVKAMLSCFREKFGRDAKVTFCSRSNRTDEEIYEQFKAEAEKTGKPMRPCTRGDRSPHAIIGNILDIGYGPNDEEDFDLIQPCAKAQGYGGGHCGIPNDPYHIYKNGGKTCVLGTYNAKKMWWKAHRWLQK